MPGLATEAAHVLIVFPPVTTSGLTTSLQGTKWALQLFPNMFLHLQGVLYLSSLVS